MKSNTSACSGDNLLRFSSYMSPAIEKSLSEGTEVGGALKYLLASFANTGNRNLLVAHQFKESSLPLRVQKSKCPLHYQSYLLTPQLLGVSLKKHCNSAVFCHLDVSSSSPSIDTSDSEGGCSVSLDFSSATLCFKLDLTFPAVPTWLKHLSLNLGSSAVLNVSISLDSAQAYRCFNDFNISSASLYEHHCQHGVFPNSSPTFG